MKVYGKYGPKMSERWAVLKDITLEGEDESPKLKIELIDVAKKDLRQIADELVCSSFGSSTEVDETHIMLYGFDPLMGDIDLVEDTVRSLLREYNYQLS